MCSVGESRLEIGQLKIGSMTSRCEVENLRCKMETPDLSSLEKWFPAYLICVVEPIVLPKQDNECGLRIYHWWCSRPNISIMGRSYKARRSAFLNYIQSAGRQILMLWNCGMSGQVGRLPHNAPFIWRRKKHLNCRQTYKKLRKRKVGNKW